MHCEEKTTKELFTMIQHLVFFVSSYFQLGKGHSGNAIHETYI